MTSYTPTPTAQTRDEARVWQRYVAIGDSFTEGMSDPDPREDDAYVGWADRLAVALAEQNEARGSTFEYANLAIRGRLLADVIGPQLDAALAMEPDLVSLVGGGNDIMRPSVDLDDVAARIEDAVVRLKDAGADVMLATMVNPVDSKVMGRLRPRISWHVANLWGIAQRHDCFVLDVWSMRALRDSRMWGIDRLHLSTEGHKRVAQQAAWTLGLPTTGEWLAHLPAQAPKPRRQRFAEDAEWARQYLAPWVERRLKGTSSGDNRLAKRPEATPVDLVTARSLFGDDGA